MEFSSEYYLVDIDGTLTDYRQNAPFETLNGNFLFPIFRDLMTENGWTRDAAEKAIIELSEQNIFWDYPDYIAEFSLPVPEAFRRMRQWHREHPFSYDDTADMVRRLSQEGRKLFIMSNNPYLGCILKLQVAGLAEDDFSSPFFRRVFGTNLLHGCKGDPAVWRRALAQIPAPVSEIGVIGDNPVEDGEIPRSLGIRETIIIPRRGSA